MDLKVQLQLALRPFCHFCLSFYLNSSFFQVLNLLTLLVKSLGYLHKVEGFEVRNIFLIGRCRAFCVPSWPNMIARKTRSGH